MAASVYSISMERNHRSFQQKALPVDHVAQPTINSICDFLCLMLGVKPTVVNRSLCAKWGLLYRSISKCESVNCRVEVHWLFCPFLYWLVVSMLFLHRKFNTCTTASISNGAHVRNTLEPSLNTSLEHNMNKFSKSTTEEEF